MKNFIDIDKDKKILYNNLYLDELKIVIKMPLIENKNFQKDIKIEKFDLTKYIFLLSY